MKKKTKEEFIERAKSIYGDKYDYSKVEYINNKTKVCIVCPKHGEFWQTPNDHIGGHSCSKCNGGVGMNKDEWVSKCKKIHGDKYDYSKVEYKNSSTKVCIICPEHGEFWQAPINHSIGQCCPKCANMLNSNTRAMGKETFIKKAINIHGDKYDYSKVEYINNHTEVCIICPKHGEFWQKPNVHLLKHGCPKCSLSKLEIKMGDLLFENNIKYVYQANKKYLPWLGMKSLDFYIPEVNIAIECQGMQHFKPIDFFGGEKQFKETVKRDNVKKNLCNKHGIDLLYFSDKKYSNDVITNEKEIIEKIKKKIW